MGLEEDAPLFSIISVIKNVAARESMFRRSVQSVLGQTCGHLEFVIQDGGSTDDTARIVEGFDDPRIRFVSTVDSGPEEGFFRALKRCRGTYIGSCLSDEELLPDALENAHKVFEKHPDIAGLYGDVSYVDEQGNKWGPRVPPHPFSIEAYVRQRLVPPFCSSFFRREAVEKAGLHEHPWRFHIGEFEFWIRVAGAGRIIYAPCNISHFGRHSASNTCMAKTAEQLAGDRAKVMADLFRENRILAEADISVDQAIAGNYIWAANTVFGIEGPSEAFARLVAQAARHDSQAPGLTQLRQRLPRGGGAASSPSLTRQFAEALSAARKPSPARAGEGAVFGARPSPENADLQRSDVARGTDRHGAEPFRAWIESLARRHNRLYYRDQSSRTLSSLATLARETDPSVVVELGTLAGLSLRTWIAATGRAKIFAVDLSFGRLHETRRFLPLDLSRVTLVEQNILQTDLSAMWGPDDRVILFIDAHDLPGVPIMEHVLTSAVPALPDGSLVVVDDLWFSPERLTRENARAFLDRQVVPQIDELQCFEGHYAPYHRGGSFMGFAEVGPLLKFVNRHGIELRREDGAKHVYFTWRRECLSREQGSGEPHAAEDAACWGSVTYNPLESVPASPALRGTMEKLAAAYRQGRVREVAEALYSLLRQDRDDAAVAYGLAVCLARGGALTEARSVLEQSSGEATHPRYRRLLTDLVHHREPESTVAAVPVVRSSAGESMTLFAMPKPFAGHTATIQKNAIRSWAKLTPRPEILLFGEEPGIREMAQEVGARHIPEIERNEFGTPRVDKLFRAAQEHASHEVLAYVNADMILFPDFTEAAEKARARFPAFLLIGRRWDLPVTGEIDFAATAWRQAVCAEIRENGMLHAECGLDYFVFSKGLWPEIPPFAIGRTMWDNWLVGDPCRRGVPVIDGTEFVTVVHQDHDYGHLKGGRDEAWRGVEAGRNRSLVRPSGNSGYTSGTPWVLRCDGTVASASPRMPTFVADPYRKQRAAWLLRQAWRLTEMDRKDLALARCEETIAHFEAWLSGKIQVGRRCGPMDVGEVVEQYTSGLLALAQLYVRLGRPERVVALYTRLLENTCVRMPEARRQQITQLRDRMRRHVETVNAPAPEPVGRKTAGETSTPPARDERHRPKVTVITACRNEESHLEECLESILQQTMTEWELLLFDDGSTDGTQAIMERYAARDRRIQLFFFDDSRGPYVRRNDAIATSRADFIVIHDADDIMCPSKLERLYDGITQDDRLAVVGSFYRAFLDGFHEIEHCEDVVLPTSHEEILDNYRKKGISAWCPHGMAIIRKRLFDEIGVYDANPFGADSLWMVKLLEYAARTDAIRLAVVPEFLALRRMHMHSQTGMLPCFDPRSRRARYWEYCLDRLSEAFTRLNQNPAADVGAELRRVDCGDFVEKNGHLFAEWESEPLTNERIAGFWERIVQHFLQERFVQCVLTCGIVEGLVEGIARTIRGYELVRGAAYFALGLPDRANECLQRELDAHGTSAARDLRDWCCAEGDLLDTRAKRISLIKTVLSPTDSPARPGAEPAGPSQDAPEPGLPDHALGELERRFRAMPDNHAAKQVLALRIAEIAQRLRLPEKSQAWKREAALLAGGRAV